MRDRVAPGVLFAVYLVLAGVERLLVEIIRRNDSVVAGLTLPQLVSLGMIAAGAAWLGARRRELTPA
jgi:phosphatidylglycerol:prolipoprotein diacylglycerol transferase